MTLTYPSIDVVSIASLVVAGEGAELLAVESSRSRRKETPILNVTRYKIKSYKSKSDKYESNMRMEVVGGNTSDIVRSRINAKATHNKASKADQEAAISNRRGTRGGFKGGQGGTAVESLRLPSLP